LFIRSQPRCRSGRGDRKTVHESGTTNGSYAGQNKRRSKLTQRADERSLVRELSLTGPFNGTSLKSSRRPNRLPWRRDKRIGTCPSLDPSQNTRPSHHVELPPAYSKCNGSQNRTTKLVYNATIRIVVAGRSRTKRESPVDAIVLDAIVRCQSGLMPMANLQSPRWRCDGRHNAEL